MDDRSVLRTLQRYYRAERAFAYGVRHNLIGEEFGRFGKRLGWRLVSRAQFSGLRFVLAPVNCTRYFEFDFAKRALPPDLRRTLDVSSPALFSLYVASHNPQTTITMINPDLGDISRTGRLIDTLNLSNVHTAQKAVHHLSQTANGFDCIWSISVLEHVSGAYDDRQTMQMVYAALRSGGRLIITVPVDRRFWVEYREQDYYGTQQKEEAGYFFQRFYDLEAIEQRLLAPIGQEPSQVSWFGETSAGRFHAYIRRWMDSGLDCIVDDPREIVDHYREFDRWQDMPGTGVCGLVIDKP